MTIDLQGKEKGPGLRPTLPGISVAPHPMTALCGLR